MQGLSAEVGEGERLITGLKKKVFTTSYIAVLIKMLLEFDRFFKVQKAESISLHSKRGLYWGGGLITGCIFCLQVDGPINEGGGAGL